MNSAIDLVILALACARITNLVVYEKGPFKVFSRIREYFGIEHDDYGRHQVIPDTFMGELLTCPYCASIWMGAFIALGYAITPLGAVALMLPFALSAVAVYWRKRTQ